MTPIEQFAERVGKFISYEGLGKYNQERVRILAVEFGTALPTPVRWANGVANPHPVLKRFILDFIDDYDKKEEDPAN